MVKPFLPRELVLRIQAILKRVYSSPQEQRLIFQLGEQTIDLDNTIVFRDQEE